MSGEADYAYKGTYYIKDISKSGNKATLTAYDCISLLDEVADAWVSTLSYPITLTRIINSMGNKVGLSISSIASLNRASYTVYNNFMTSNITYRQILQYIAEILNVNFIADLSQTNNITYKAYTSTTVVIDNSKYIKLTMSDYEIEPIDKVQIQSTFDDIGYVAGTGTNAYIVTENPLFFTSEKQSTITTIASQLLGELKTIKYTPMKFSTYKDFGINCGDIITVNGKTCYVMKKSIKSSGCEFECVGNKRRDTQKTEVNSAITALNNKTNELVRTVDETKSTLTEVRGSMKTLTDEQGEIKEQIATITTDVSEVKQTAQGLTSKVSSVETTLNNLDGEVTTLKSRVSTVEQTVDSITTRVEVAEGTANEAKTMASEAKQTANSFSTKITEVEKTANSAKTTASEAKQTANSFSTRITEVEETANGAATTASEAKQTANSFSTRITTAEGNASSALQTASKIDWVIQSGTSSTNFTLTDRTISLVSSNIDLTGYVTINSLKAGGTTTIDGGRITTGTISADRIDLTSLKVRNIYNDDNNLILTSARGYMYIGGDTSAKRTDSIWFRTGSILFSTIGDSSLTFNLTNKYISTDGTWKLGLSTSQGFKEAYITKLYLGGGGGYITMDASKNFYINDTKISGSSNAISKISSGLNYVELSGTTFKPQTSSYSLGASSTYWGTAYITKLYLSSSCYITAGSSSSIKVGTTTISGSSGSSTTSVSKLTSGRYSVSLSSQTLAPSASGTFELGSSSSYWNNVYAYALWLKSGYSTVKLTCYSSGELAINGRKATHA